MVKKIRHSIKSALRERSKSEKANLKTPIENESQIQSNPTKTTLEASSSAVEDKPMVSPLPVNNLKIGEPTKKDLDDFFTLQELRRHLQDCYLQKTDLQINNVPPYNEILRFILAKATGDHHLSQFSDVLKIVDLIDKIDKSQKRNFKEYEYFLTEILQNYYQKITPLLKDQENIDTLKTFFSVYNKDVKIDSLRKASGFINPFSNVHKVKDLINDIDAQFKTFSKIQEQNERQSSQMTYWGLLQDVLEEKGTVSLLHMVTEQNSNENSSSSLLSTEEYDPPSAEPEHPSRIGINTTMSFKPTDEKNSLIEAFSTKVLQQEFLESFAWGLSSVYSLKKAKPNPSSNLLGTVQLYSPEVQVAVMKYILLSLDAIGKISGFEGGFAIENFILIKKIVTNIETLSTSLNESSFVDNTVLLDNLTKLTQELKQLNISFYEAQAIFNPDLKVEKNPEMNLFCHINEILTSILMDKPLEETLLMPDKPASPDAEKIEKIRVQFSQQSTQAPELSKKK